MFNRKRVFYGDRSPAVDSEIMSDKAGNKRWKRADTSVNGICPLRLHAEVIEIAESDEEKHIVGGGGATGRSQLPASFSGGQRNLHAWLKTEIAKLCKALKLSEDIVHLIQRLLEYLVKNYDVNKGNTPHLHALQMSLCWIAGDILGKKIDRKGSLVEARKILNFECAEDMANSVYKILTSKETFQQFHGKINDSISPRNVVSPLADIAVSSSNLQEPCVKGEAVEIGDLEENQESRDKMVAAIKRKKLRKVRKHCKKKELELRQEHEETVQEFIKIWKEKREKLMAEVQVKMDVLKKNQNPSGTKLSKLLEESKSDVQDLEDSMEWNYRQMEKKQAAEMEELKRKCEKLLATAEEWYGSGGSTIINDSNANDVTTGAPPITIASDVVILNVSATVETEIVNEVASTIGDAKGDLVSLGCHSGGSLPEDAPSTVGMDPADCVKPVDLQSANASDNGTTEEPNTVVSPHEHGDSAGFHNQHVADDCRSSTDLQEASIPGTHIIMDPADCDGCPDSHTAEEVDKIHVGEQSTGDHTQNLVGPTQVDEKAGEVYKQSVLENGEDGVLLSSDNATDKVDSRDCRHDSDTAGEPDKIRAGEESGGAQPQNLLVSPIQVDKSVVELHKQSVLQNGEDSVGQLHKQPVLQNGEDGMLLSSDNATDSVDSRYSRHDSDTAGEPDKRRVGEESGGAQPQNVASLFQVDESVVELHKQSVLQNGEDSVVELHKQSVLQNGEDSVGELHKQSVLPNGEDSVGQLHEPGDAAELQNDAVLSNRSNLVVSAEHDSSVHKDLPSVSGIDHETNGEQFVGFQNPESISAVFPLSLHPQFAWLTNQWLLGEPLQAEYTKRCNEKEQVDKLHEDANSQLKAACEKEIQEMYAQMREKYTKKLRDAESSCTVKKAELEAKDKKLVMNRFLANGFRSKCQYLISSGSSNVVQPGAPSGHLHQQRFVSSSQASLRHSHVASSSPLSQPAMVNPVYSGQRWPVVSLASSQPATIQQTNNIPCAQFTPRSLNPFLTHSRLPQISTVTPTIGTARVGGSFVRAPAPHIQPFRPPPSSSQAVRLGINPNHVNVVQPWPPSFSAADLPNRNVPVLNNQAVKDASGCDAQALSGVASSNVVCLSDDDMISE